MVSRYLRSALCSVALLGIAATSALSATMNYLGAWSNTTTYTTGSVIVYNKGIFYSLKSTNSAPNRNFIPSSNPTWWAPVGTVGNTILSGVVNPTSPTLGQVGDYYINTMTNTMFGPKTANGWSASGVSLVGPKGDAGAQGVQGAPGMQGVAGAQGPVGPQGATGSEGAQGIQGIAGNIALAGKSCLSGYMIGFDNNGDIICSCELPVGNTEFISVNDSGRCFAINKVNLPYGTLITQATVAASCSSLGSGWTPYLHTVGFNLTNPAELPAPYNSLFRVMYSSIPSYKPPLGTQLGLFGSTNGPFGYGYAAYYADGSSNVRLETVNSGSNFLVTSSPSNYLIRYVCTK